MLKKLNLNSIQAITIVFIAFFLAFFNSYGLVVNKNGGWGTLSGHWKSGNLFLLFIFELIIFSLIPLIIRKIFLLKTSNRAGKWAVQINLFFSDFKKTFIFLVIVWGVMLLPFFPLLSNWDIAAQIHEVIDTRSSLAGNNIFNVYPIAHYLTDNTTGLLSNQHGAFLTLLYGMPIKYSWIWYHSYLPAYLLLGFLHFFFAVFAYTISLNIVHKHASSLRLINFLTFLLILNPVLILSTIQLSKNPLLVSALVIFFSVSLKLYFDSEKMTNWWWTLIAISVVIGSIAVKWAEILFIVSGFLFFILYKKSRKKIIFSIVVPVTVLKIFLIALIHFGVVIQDDPIEGKGLQIQQIARYVKTYPNDINTHEYKVLDKVLDVKNLGHLYNPVNVDPVKSSGYSDKFDAITREYNPNANDLGYRFMTVRPNDWKEFNKVWFNLGKKHPQVYIDATISQIGNYVEPSQVPIIDIYSTFSSADVGNGYGNLNNSKWLKTLYHNKYRDYFSNVYGDWFNKGPLNWLLHGNFWIFVLLVTLPLFELSWKKFAIILPLLLQVFVAMLAPLANSTRYTIGLIALVPLLLMVINSKNENIEK